jgi:HK97 gp10 family phage protein
LSGGVVDWRQQEVLAEMAGRVASGMDRACAFAAEQARGMVPRASGRLAGAIDYNLDVHGMKITGRVGVKRHVGAFYGRFVELGTSGHVIKARRKKTLAGGGVIFGKKVKHQGTMAQPFLRPAVFNNLDEIRRLICGG